MAVTHPQWYVTCSLPQFQAYLAQRVGGGNLPMDARSGTTPWCGSVVTLDTGGEIGLLYRRPEALAAFPEVGRLYAAREVDAALGTECP